MLATTWLAARALGRAVDAADPIGAAVRMFDTLRLARGVHEAFAWRGLGKSDEDRWQRAALVRCALVHPEWRAGGKPGVAEPWRDDAEARWLIGAHESGGTHWFRSEAHARLVWWRVLPALLGAVNTAGLLRASTLAGADAWANTELARATTAQWKFDALLAGETAAAARAPATTVTSATVKPATDTAR